MTYKPTREGVEMCSGISDARWEPEDAEYRMQTQAGEVLHNVASSMDD
jgi:hypothetical protein